jgi:hypothetical protein
MVKGIVAVIGFGAVILSWTPIAAHGWALAAAGYAIVLGAVTLIGCDYTDCHDVLRRVCGVGLIAESLKP